MLEKQVRQIWAFFSPAIKSWRGFSLRRTIRDLSTSRLMCFFQETWRRQRWKRSMWWRWTGDYHFNAELKGQMSAWVSIAVPPSMAQTGGLLFVKPWGMLVVFQLAVLRCSCWLCCPWCPLVLRFGEKRVKEENGNSTPALNHSRISPLRIVRPSSNEEKSADLQRDSVKSPKTPLSIKFQEILCFLHERVKICWSIYIKCKFFCEHGSNYRK